MIVARRAAVLAVALILGGCGSTTPPGPLAPSPTATGSLSMPLPPADRAAAPPSPAATGATPPALTQAPTPAPTLSPLERELTPSLKDEAQGSGMLIGEEMTGYGQGNPAWMDIFTSQFNLATVDWGVYWGEVERSPGVFDFSTADRQVAIARARGMRVRAHALVFPNDLPAWVTSGHFSRAALSAILVNHVRTVVGHFAGQVDEWVVVNEPYIVPYRPDDIFYKTIGPGYIDLAFRTARAADPSAKLIFNDSDNESSLGGQNGLTTRMDRQVAARLKAEGLLDMVGLEMHLRASDPPSRQDVAATMKGYGVPVAVTEFDVDLHGVKGTEKSRLALQAKVASAMVGACRQSGVCREFGLWGIWDTYSFPLLALGESDSEATPFDENLQPKPEYFAIRNALAAAGPPGPVASPAG